MASSSIPTLALAGHDVARIGYGAMQLTHGGQVDHRTAVDVLRRALDCGANHLDTAWFYGSGSCNALIREALAPYPADVFIATKLGADNDADGGLVAAQLPHQLRRQVEANLTSLDVDRLDMAYLRRLDYAPGIIASGEQKVDIDHQLAELAAMREEGKIGAIALSNVDAAQLRNALPVGIDAVQNAYNLLDRDTEPVLDACREHGIAWVPYFPLGSGFPGRRKVTEDATVLDIADEQGATAGQIGLAWLLAHYDRTLLIPGTANPDHLSENFRSVEIELGPDAVTRLDAVAG